MRAFLLLLVVGLVGAAVPATAGCTIFGVDCSALDAPADDPASTTALPGTSARAYADLEMRSGAYYDWGATPRPLPPQGCYGGCYIDEDPSLEPASGAEPGPFVRVRGVAWTWTDADNDGAIDANEKQGAARAFSETSALITPGPGGWPPGAAIVRDYRLVSLREPTLDTEPLAGSGPAELRFDPECSLSRSCGTRDAVLLPAGSLGVGLVATATACFHAPGGTVCIPLEDEAPATP